MVSPKFIASSKANIMKGPEIVQISDSSSEDDDEEEPEENVSYNI